VVLATVKLKCSDAAGWQKSIQPVKHIVTKMRPEVHCCGLALSAVTSEKWAS